MRFKKSTFLAISLVKQLKSSSRTFSTDPHVLTKEVGDKVVVSLNRPGSLNALGSSSLKQLLKTLQKFEKEKSLVIVKGTGDRSFCAGFDILEVKAAVEAKKIEKISENIFDLNALLFLLHSYKIPTVALMNGITFGGGAGLAYFCKYRIATEKTAFAMPESKIAFHPNAGGTYFLNRAKGKLGCYLALTGNSLNGSDVTRAGFATHYCLSNKLCRLEESLLSSTNEKNVHEILDSLCEKNIPEFSLSPVIDKIDKYFSEPSVEAIFSKLKEDGSDWAKRTLDNLNKYSPSSLKVILKQMQKGENWALEKCLLMEGNLTNNFYRYPDVIEGTRITLVDKGDKPNWRPSRLEDVTEEHVESHFQPCQEETHRQLLNVIRDR